MKRTVIIGLLSLFVACGNQQTVNTNQNATPAKGSTTAAGSNPSSGSATGTADSGVVNFPFAEFARVETTAQTGEYILCPSYTWIEDAAEKGADSTSFIWYQQKMAAPGAELSEVEFLSERQKVPNAYIIAIPSKQTAQTGDIVLTWWQSGSGMSRAIVVDDKDPAAPVVRYLDIDYDNPAKSRDGQTTIGRMDEKLKADSFFKIKEWDSGTSVGVQDGANLKFAHLIRIVGDKALVLEGVGNLKVYPKSLCTAAPVAPGVKAGDKVKAPRYGTSFQEATVARVEARIGRVFVKFDGSSDEKAIAFGDVLK